MLYYWWSREVVVFIKFDPYRGHFFSLVKIEANLFKELNERIHEVLIEAEVIMIHHGWQHQFTVLRIHWGIVQLLWVRIGNQSILLAMYNQNWAPYFLNHFDVLKSVSNRHCKEPTNQVSCDFLNRFKGRHQNQTTRLSLLSNEASWARAYWSAQDYYVRLFNT